jgi:transcriptional regulator with XRE-family HTH domain
VGTDIGSTLRDARNRRKLSLEQVEAEIKIRARYLQAMENEEWDALPGGAYTRGFIRTYAYHLGLDGERLADDYRRDISPPSGDRVPKRVEPVPASARRDGSRVGGWLLAAGVCLALAAVLVVVALAGGGGGGDGSHSAAKRGSAGGSHGNTEGGVPAAKPGVAMRLAATGEVWVCVLDSHAKPLVDGQILDGGAEAGPFRSARFEVALGNGSVTMFVDGKRASIEESSSPVGYEIDSQGDVRPLEEGERPSCE